MENNNLEFLLNDNITLDSSNFVVNLFVAALLSVIIQIFYLKYSTTLSSKFEFSKNFVILGITTTIVITIIKSSLALSLGLVGALSIVRFRAAIKEPEELVFLFLIISTGLGCGAGQIKIISIGILFSLISIFLYSKFFKKRYLKLADTLNLAIIADKKLSEKEVNEKMDEIKKYTSKIELISFSKSEDNTTINFDVQLNNFSDLNKLTEILQKNDTRVLFARNDLTAL
ncbi:MAG: DUF4956 domain-containing protein [Pelagibacterales bacterium]|nr:DUF4956 domain-containing protein [Pelagibacterales bacterium]